MTMIPVLDIDDECQLGNLSWTSTPQTDHDMDGCADLTEDDDDDNDMVLDGLDRCPNGDLQWVSTTPLTTTWMAVETLEKTLMTMMTGFVMVWKAALFGRVQSLLY